MFGKIAAFELRYQFRNPVFWVVFILFFLFAFGAVATPNISIGSGGNVHKNSPQAIMQAYQIFSLFFMFVTVAFVANVVVRDDDSGFGPIVRTTRVSKFAYLMGRFVGAWIIAAIAFLSIPIGMIVGSAMPWVDPETLGPGLLSHYAYAFVVLALPNLLLTSAIFFGVATLTRSMMWSYVGVVLFLVLYTVLLAVVSTQPEWRETAAYLEPFGLGAVGYVTRYWTAAEANTMMPAFAGMLLVNRAIWFVVSIVALLIAIWRFRFIEKGAASSKPGKVPPGEPLLVDRLPDTRPDAANASRLWARCRFEMAQVFKSPAFFVLMVIGLFNAIGALIFANEIYGTPGRPLTFALIPVLLGAFSIIPVIIAVYYAGELVWRDRDRKMHEIVDATSLPNWAYLVPKVLAVSLVLFSTLAISVIAAVLVQLFRGQTDLALGSYFGWYLMPLGVDMIILAILAVFIQALVPNKYLGWGLMVVYVVATLTLSNLGFDHPLYLYGSTGAARFSDMNGDQIGGATGWWLRLYWGAWALILAVLAHLLWRRGTEDRLSPRLRRMPARLAGGPGVLLALGVVVAAASGGWIFYNMNVLNLYRNSDEQEKLLADFEKKYLKYEGVAQPALTDIKLDVAIHPADRQAVVKGVYRFVNDTGQPVPELHVRLQDQQTRLVSVTVPGATLASNDAAFKYRIYRFAKPLAPGATGTLSFETIREQKGIRANGEDTRLVANGTFLNNGEFAPLIGMDRSGLLQDRVKRRRYGLTPELRPAKLEDQSARMRNYVGNADWVRSDITVSTDADQTPIAPGRKVADMSANGRRTARFVSTAPILSFFSVQSARYAEKTMDAGGGVKLTVFYHPAHAYNTDTMLKAMKASLDYYRGNFGPYQFDYARIIEFPGYASFAQAFAGTMPYSESLGFLADNSDPDEIDYVTYVTAHEVAHQYWAHQLISADQQGGTVLVETMAQYSALMVMKKLYGEDKIRRFLKYELDNYLRSRGGEVIEELPLLRVENQGYIHYRKGALVMYLLQDRLGEDRMNTMLAGLLDRYRFKGAPYAASTDLLAGLNSIARNPAERQLISDLFERITIYDLKVTDAKTRPVGGGRFETVVTVEGKKFHADGRGKETEAPLADTIDIGLFAARPGVGAFAAKDVLLMERRPVNSGKQQIRIVTNGEPKIAGVDPYNKYVDRNSDDNVAAVTR
ncbi:M1 family aminopeptidase [Sphingomonas sp. BGYR3]|uniref:ABC transporter permease/M1 family aminopeptidase n=1 Tax=Sphingomonas sp. BGYR3 TaxID=2975483 RepID=UPI0021A6BDF4|nr:M1 family aminopeptidase [Sphingomonas sp. BGYR3]MDG5488496.1 M1 family aminopeptidase [Sphingomonas sp. BGYR3]